MDEQDYEHRINAYERQREKELLKKINGLYDLMKSNAPMSEPVRQYIIQNSEDGDDFEDLALTLILLKQKGIAWFKKQIEEAEKSKTKGQEHLDDYLDTLFGDGWKQS